MGLFSILPEYFSSLETWLIRIFLFLAALTLGPWLLLLVYDILLYIWRAATFELPFIGGRARGLGKPTAPTLTSRPDGHRRRGFSLPGLGDATAVMADGGARHDDAAAAAATGRNSGSERRRVTVSDAGAGGLRERNLFSGDG